MIIERDKETNKAWIHERFVPTEYDQNKIDEINKDLYENYEEIKEFQEFTLMKVKK